MHWEEKSLGEIAKALDGTKARFSGSSNETQHLNINDTHPAEYTLGPVLHFVIEFAVLNHANLNKLIKKINQTLIK